MCGSQENGAGHLAQQNTGFGILLERENIFDHHQVRHFLPQHPENFGINDLKAFGLFLFLGCGDTAEGKPVDAQTVSVNHADPCIGKAGIFAMSLVLRLDITALLSNGLG